MPVPVPAPLPLPAPPPLPPSLPLPPPLPLPPLWMLQLDASPCIEMYSSATRRSVVVDIKPSSMPPHTPCSLGVQNASGSTPFTTPR